MNQNKTEHNKTELNSLFMAYMYYYKLKFPFRNGTSDSEAVCFVICNEDSLLGRLLFYVCLM